MGTSLALGCGGRSYVGKLHFCSPYAITGKECLKRLEEYEKTVDFTDVRHGILLSEEEIQRRYLIRHLLIYPGVDIQKYESCFGSGLMEDFPVLQDWMEQGWIRWNGSQEKKVQEKGGGKFLALTQTGLGLSDFLGPRLISPGIQRAMEEWEEMYGRSHGTL